MRPRVFPAEDVPVRVFQPLRTLGASMRPRVFPAEDDVTSPPSLLEQDKLQ